MHMEILYILLYLCIGLEIAHADTLWPRHNIGMTNIE